MSTAVDQVTTFKLAGRKSGHPNTRVQVGEIMVGGADLVIMAGPCAVESEDQLFEVAEILISSGIRIMRGGAYKPRTSPYSFQGLAEQGLYLLNKVRCKTGLLIVTEVIDSCSAAAVASCSDILQVGSRNMHNYSLLRELGKLQKPVLLKRGISATIEEWLMAAEYIMKEGNNSVILCERGIRTFEPYTRNTLDLSAVPLVKELSHLPVIVDPSHGTGKCSLVPAMSKAAVIAGADGLIIEIHPCPREALSDGQQSLDPCQFSALTKELKAVARVAGRIL